MLAHQNFSAKKALNSDLLFLHSDFYLNFVSFFCSVMQFRSCFSIKNKQKCGILLNKLVAGYWLFLGLGKISFPPNLAIFTKKLARNHENNLVTLLSSWQISKRSVRSPPRTSKIKCTPNINRAVISWFSPLLRVGAPLLLAYFRFLKGLQHSAAKMDHY